MDDKILQVIDHRQEGFLPLMSFEDWRIAGLNHAPLCDRDAPEYAVERHLETDEVFILTEGRAWLLMAGNEDVFSMPEIVEMQIGVVYNVRKLAWHGTLMEQGARILLVEKKDTGTEADTVRRTLPKAWRDELARRSRD